MSAADNELGTEAFRNERHFLQSSAWAQFQRVRGNRVLQRSGPGWEYQAVEEHGKFGNRLYCPYGPTVANEAALKEALADLRRQAAKLKVDFVRVEPRNHYSEEALSSLGLKRSHHDVQPPDTIVSIVDAEAVTEEEIVAALAGTVRRSWRKAMREGVTYRVSNDPAEVAAFLDMLHDVAKRTGMHPHSDDYFEDIAGALFPAGSGGLIFAEQEGKPIASLIYFSDGTTMSYAHAASYSEYRKLSPATGLLVFAMLHARETGHRFFDTYGVAPEDAPEDHPWLGFTNFKKSFGGARVNFPGTWEMPVKKVKYGIYNAAARLIEQS